MAVPMGPIAASRATWVTYGDALRMFLRGDTLRSAGPIAFVVGTWLSAVNHGELLLQGRIPWIKIAVDYATPFVVASLGFLAARRRRGPMANGP